MAQRPSAALGGGVVFSFNTVTGVYMPLHSFDDKYGEEALSSAPPSGRN
jgi:hypothetical protein